jgi:hypothetical protein
LASTKNLYISSELKVPSCKSYPCETPSSLQLDSSPHRRLLLQVLQLTASSPLLALELVLVTEFQLAFKVFEAGYPSPAQKQVLLLSH